MRHYCSIFDKYYLIQGLAVYKSLRHSSEEYKFYPLCMDKTSYDLIKKMNLEYVIPIQLDDIMTDELNEVQSITTKGQFCWVCQPIICQYILNIFKAEIVIYLEADSLFYADPEILITELSNYSVSLVPHNFSPEFDNSKIAGEYCVQFNAFKNDRFAQDVLNYWKENCFKYTKLKPNVYPGQLCLNNWIRLYANVKSIENIGAGVAPWNVNKYKVSTQINQIYVDNQPLVFYHFHQYGQYKNTFHELGFYPLKKKVIQLIYGKYIRELLSVKQLVLKTDPTFNYFRYYETQIQFFNINRKNIKQFTYSFYTLLKRKFKGSYNVFSNKYFGIDE